MALTVAWVSLGWLIGENRTLLGIFFVAWGSLWFTCMRTLAKDEGYLTQLLEGTAWSRQRATRSDFSQNSFLTFGTKLVGAMAWMGVVFVFGGIWVLWQSVLL